MRLWLRLRTSSAIKCRNCFLSSFEMRFLSSSRRLRFQRPARVWLSSSSILLPHRNNSFKLVASLKNPTGKEVMLLPQRYSLSSATRPTSNFSGTNCRPQSPNCNSLKLFDCPTKAPSCTEFPIKLWFAKTAMNFKG